MRGYFTIVRKGEPDLIVPNLIVQTGQQAMLLSLFQSNDATWPSPMYMGLADQTVAVNTTLQDISTEPTSQGGYARQPLALNSVDWPTVALENTAFVARTKLVIWLPSGADYSRSFTRLFLTNAAAGSIGQLFCMSGALPSELLLTDGVPYNVYYTVALVGA